MTAYVRPLFDLSASLWLQMLSTEELFVDYHNDELHVSCSPDGTIEENQVNRCIRNTVLCRVPKIREIIQGILNE